MISNEQTPVSVRTYKGSVDEYGEKREDYTERNSSMYVKRLNHTTVDDPRFQKCEFIGLTKEIFSDRDYVMIGNKEYHVFLFTKTPRWNVVYLEYEY